MLSAFEHKVLIVDDEELFLKSANAGLEEYADIFSVVTASNAEEAIQRLKAEDFSLVVTDIKMPKMSGIRLLAHIIRMNPDMPVIMMTAFGSPEIEKMVADLDICDYIEKPIDLDDLAERIISQLDSSGLGHLRGFTLPTLIQMIAMDKLTCTVEIGERPNSGRLFFRQGILYDARFGDKTGEAAALEMLAWERPEVGLIPGCRVRRRRIDSSLELLLLEAARLKDERRQAENAGSSPIATSKPSDDGGNTKPISRIKRRKEERMSKRQIEECLEFVSEELGAGLESANIWTGDGMLIGGINTNPKSCAVFARITENIKKSLATSNLPALEDYYLIRTTGNSAFIIMLGGEYQMGLEVDLDKTNLGILLNMVLPESVTMLKKASK